MPNSSEVHRPKDHEESKPDHDAPDISDVLPPQELKHIYARVPTLAETQENRLKLIRDLKLAGTLPMSSVNPLESAA